jgi:predicted DNA-binding ribbon-helix-helix protein
MKTLGKWFRSRAFFDLVCRMALVGITFSGFYFTILSLHNSFLRECQTIAYRQSMEIGALHRQIASLRRRTGGLLARVDAYEHIFQEYLQKTASGAHQ